MDDRDIAALTQYLTVLPEAPGLYQVVSGSGSTYIVDAREAHCTCPDHEYREVRCKHTRRVEFETGRRPLPRWIDRDDLPRDFSSHVDEEPEWDDDRGIRARVQGVHTQGEVLE